MEFYKEPINKIISSLNSNITTGLTNKQVKEKLKKFGSNIIKSQKRISPITIFIKQFSSPLMFILFLASILSFIIREKTDAIVISIAVFLNVIVGFIQELKAEKSVQALKALEVLNCVVKRNNKIYLINAKNLVPGDIVLLSAGSKIPADIRLINTIDFQVEEAILTGESKPIIKNRNIITKKVSLGDQLNMAFSGTTVLSGKATGIVVATGQNSQIGKITKLVIETKKSLTPLQKQIKIFSWWLGGIFLVTTIFVFIFGLLKNLAFYKMMIISIALGVAAIPEGLLVGLTVILAIGMQRMLKRKALVRHLIAAETSGCVSVICTDKTGTLTKGHMQVVQIITSNFNIKFNQSKINLPKIFQNEELKNLAIALTLNNDAQLQEDKKIIGQPTEIALLQMTNEAGLSIDILKKEHPRITEIPFSSELKYMVTINKFNNHEKLIIKGTPEIILSLIDHKNKTKFLEAAKTMTKNGLRVLAIAYKEINSINKNKYNDKNNIKKHLSNLIPLGLIGIQDPLRKEVKQTVEELKRAGIKIVLVTGDHKDTALNIAKNAGIKTNKNGIITGEKLKTISEKELTNKIETIDIFARVDPKDKIRIVNAWKLKGQTIAMIGDGVNDAPALKAADIGIALGSGSDVAHEISDMVLLDNNLSSVDAAVKQGRAIFDNIRKIITYLMIDSFSEIILITGSLLLGLPLPIYATQIFWINLVSDGFPYLALTMEPPEKNIMNEPPRKKNEPILNTEMKVLIFIIGLITDLGLFLLYFFLLKFKFHIAHIHTIIFTALAIDSLFYIFSVRTFRTTIFKSNPLRNKWLIPAVFFGFISQLMVVYLPPLQKLFYTVPLNFMDWVIILILSILKILGIEITKDFFILEKKKVNSI